MASGPSRACRSATGGRSGMMMTVIMRFSCILEPEAGCGVVVPGCAFSSAPGARAEAGNLL